MKTKTFSRILKVTSFAAVCVAAQAMRLSKVAEDLADQAETYIHQSYLGMHTWKPVEVNRSEIQVVWNGILYTLYTGGNILKIHVSVNMFDLKMTSIEIQDAYGQHDLLEL